LLERVADQAAALDAPWPNAAVTAARGAVLLARGDADEAAAALGEAAAAFRDLGYRPDAARARLLEGRALLRAGRRSRATNAIGEARGQFTAMAAAGWEARAATELERASPGRASGELTPAESRIAGLVAQGMKTARSAAPTT
jgi:hypothetical protein